MVLSPIADARGAFDPNELRRSLPIPPADARRCLVGKQQRSNLERAMGIERRLVDWALLQQSRIAQRSLLPAPATAFSPYSDIIAAKFRMSDSQISRGGAWNPFIGYGRPSEAYFSSPSLRYGSS